MKYIQVTLSPLSYYRYLVICKEKINEETNIIIGIEDKSALGLVDFEFMPHWDGTLEKLDSVREYSKLKNTVVYVCKDGDGIVVDNDEIKLICDVMKIG